MAYIINNWSSVMSSSALFPCAEETLRQCYSAVTPLFYPTQIGVPPTLIWSITDFGTEEDWRIIGAVAMVIQCKNCTEMRDFCKIGTIFTPIETIFSFRFIKIILFCSVNRNTV